MNVLIGIGIGSFFFGLLSMSNEDTDTNTEVPIFLRNWLIFFIFGCLSYGIYLILGGI